MDPKLRSRRVFSVLLQVAILLQGMCACIAQEWVPLLSNRAVYSITNGVSSVGVQKPILAGGRGGVYFRSVDNGSTWEELKIPDVDSSARMTVLVDSYKYGQTENVHIAGGLGFNGLYRSTDNGDSWTHVLYSNDSIGLQFESSGSIAHHEFTDLMFALRNNGQIYRSTDLGATWTEFSSLPLSGPMSRGRAIAGRFYRNYYRLFAGGAPAHLYTSIDTGRTWSMVDTSGMDIQPGEEIANISYSAGIAYIAVQNRTGSLTRGGGLWAAEFDKPYGKVAWQQRFQFRDTSIYAIDAFEVEWLPSAIYLVVGGNDTDPHGNVVYSKSDSLLVRLSWMRNDTVSPPKREEISDAPWMKNEDGEIGSRVWAVAKAGATIPIPGKMDNRIIATDGGVFLRVLYTTVDESPIRTTMVLPAVTLNTSVYTYAESEIRAEYYRVYTLSGSVVTFGTITTPGCIDLSNIDSPVFLLELVTASSGKWILFRHW